MNMDENERLLDAALKEWRDELESLDRAYKAEFGPAIEELKAQLAEIEKDCQLPETPPFNPSLTREKPSKNTR